MKRLLNMFVAFAIAFALATPVAMHNAAAAEPQAAMDESMNKDAPATDAGKTDTKGKKGHHKHKGGNHRAKTTSESKTIGGSGKAKHGHKHHDKDAAAPAPAAGQ